MTTIPESHKDLLERALFGHLATIRPDGTAQSNPVWYVWDGEVVKFSFSTKQQKHRNVVANPSVALSIQDPDDPYRYLEVRGVIDSIDDDPNGGEFFMELNERYNGPFTESLYPADGGIYTMRITGSSKQ
jgi:PPOX class probable F420-dependent enzyme